MSFTDEEKRPSDLEKLDSEHLFDVRVSPFSLSSRSSLQLLGTIDSVLPPTLTTIPTLTQQPLYWRMSHRTQKSGLLWPTRTILRCHPPLCVLGFLGSFGPSLFPVSTNSSSSDTLPCLSVRFVLHDCLPQAPLPHAEPRTL